MGVLYIGKDKDSFKRLYKEFTKLIELMVLSLPTAEELGKRIDGALKKKGRVKVSLD